MKGNTCVRLLESFAVQIVPKLSGGICKYGARADEKGNNKNSRERNKFTNFFPVQKQPFQGPRSICRIATDCTLPYIKLKRGLCEIRTISGASAQLLFVYVMLNDTFNLGLLSIPYCCLLPGVD